MTATMMNENMIPATANNEDLSLDELNEVSGGCVTCQKNGLGGALTYGYIGAKYGPKGAVAGAVVGYIFGYVCAYFKNHK